MLAEINDSAPRERKMVSLGKNPYRTIEPVSAVQETGLNKREEGKKSLLGSTFCLFSAQARL